MLKITTNERARTFDCGLNIRFPGSRSDPLYDPDKRMKQSPHSGPGTTMHELIIEPGRTERQYWKDIWRYRELFYFLAWRDILIRYKQTVVGVAWALIRPFLTMVALTFFFSKLAKL